MARNAGFPARRPTAASPFRTTSCPRTQWPRTLASGVSNFWAPAAACAAKMGSGRPRVFPSAVSPLTSSFFLSLLLYLCVSLSLPAPLEHHRIPPQKCAQFYESLGRNCRDAGWPGSKIAREIKSAHLSLLCLFRELCVYADWDGIAGWHAVLARRRTNTRGNTLGISNFYAGVIFVRRETCRALFAPLRSCKLGWTWTWELLFSQIKCNTWMDAELLEEFNKQKKEQ